MYSRATGQEPTSVSTASSITGPMLCCHCKLGFNDKAVAAVTHSNSCNSIWQAVNGMQLISEPGSVALRVSQHVLVHVCHGSAPPCMHLCRVRPDGPLPSVQPARAILPSIATYCLLIKHIACAAVSSAFCGQSVT
jgi:hypothetical protein